MTNNMISTTSAAHGLYEATPSAFAEVAATYPPSLVDALALAVQVAAGFGDDAYWADLEWAELVTVLASFSS